jgi:urease accessory protein
MVIITMTKASAELILYTWLSPSFPIGSFAYSHGFETAVISGTIQNKHDVMQWVEAVLHHGSLRTDCILLRHAWDYTNEHKIDEILELNQLALALSPSAERYLENSAQGNAFTKTIMHIWPCPPLANIAQKSDDMAYVIALAIAAAYYECPVDMTIKTYVLSIISNLVSACVRLGPIGQTDSQSIIAQLCPLIDDMVLWLADMTLDDIGSSSLRLDIASLQHETLYSRLFRS